MTYEKTCTANQLIAALQKLVEQYGDLPVYSLDPDTVDILPINLKYKTAIDRLELPERFEILSDYGYRPDGYLE